MMEERKAKATNPTLNLEAILENCVPPHHENYPTESPLYTCEICCESRPIYDSFNPEGCSHFYCTKCTLGYIVSKLQNNHVLNITCPESSCTGELSPLFCETILPHEVLVWWQRALCESMIPEKEKFYCPFKDCSAMMTRDGGSVDDNEIIRESECPICRRLFCAQCRVAWHAGIACEEFGKLNKDEREREDIMLVNLAKEKKWTRCPECGVYVSRTDGCSYMKCRCGHAFCYNCGTPNLSGRNHTYNCPKCGH